MDKNDSMLVDLEHAADAEALRRYPDRIHDGREQLQQMRARRVFRNGAAWAHEQLPAWDAEALAEVIDPEAMRHPGQPNHQVPYWYTRRINAIRAAEAVIDYLNGVAP